MEKRLEEAVERKAQRVQRVKYWTPNGRHGSKVERQRVRKRKRDRGSERGRDIFTQGKREEVVERKALRVYSRG
jgi:hypothetical protein